MEAIQSLSAMQVWSDRCHKDNQSIGFVPTMGYLHEGHLSLVRQAKAKSQKVVTSIFVNPLQFSPSEDLSQYPQDLRRDFSLLEKEGVDCVFVPNVKALYPQDFQSKVHVTELSKNLCGASRLGHFEGVATIVLKLFQIVNPTFSFLGEKDFQQIRVIEQMVQDFHLRTKIIRAPIVREPDGLAMSSRNKYLTADERERASILYKSLMQAKAQYQAGESSTSKIIDATRSLIQTVRPTKIDYIQICDANTLEDMLQVNKDSRLFLAVYFGHARLIDNSELI